MISNELLGFNFLRALTHFFRPPAKMGRGQSARSSENVFELRDGVGGLKTHRV
jgi:hypothetical protein